MFRALRPHAVELVIRCLTDDIVMAASAPFARLEVILTELLKGPRDLF